MTPLGWSKKTTKPEGLIAVESGSTALICAPADRLSTRDRMLHQADLVRSGLPLLPLAPRNPATVEACLAWAAASGDTLRSWLDRIEGLAQITLAFDAPPPDTVVDLGPGGWLRERAALLRQRESAAKRLMAGANALLAPLTARDWRTRSTPAGPVLDALVPADAGAVAAAMPALQRVGARSLPGWTLTLVGPLPAYAFCPQDAG